MLNKTILTGFVENVAKDEGLVYFSVPSGETTLNMEMRFSDEIVHHIDECFSKGQTVISIEGSLVSDKEGRLLISPSMVETYLVEKKQNYQA